MKIKVSELSGLALDWAVAKCEGKNGVFHNDGITQCIVIEAPSGVYKGTWKPTINWAQSGPIIERDRITLMFDADGGTYSAHVAEFRQRGMSNRTRWRCGPTPLIAAMRCYVASKLGDETEIPKELL